MTDGKAVLHGLEDEISRAERYDTKWNDCVPVCVLRGAYELLKEQEPVAPQKHYNQKADLLYACGKCRNDLKPNNRNAKFCWFCGRAVKWNT